MDQEYTFDFITDLLKIPIGFEHKKCILDILDLVRNRMLLTSIIASVHLCLRPAIPAKGFRTTAWFFQHLLMRTTVLIERFKADAVSATERPQPW